MWPKKKQKQNKTNASTKHTQVFALYVRQTDDDNIH